MKTRTPKYIVRTSNRSLGEWKVKVDGKPTAENLKKWRDAFNDSLYPGKANEHLGTNARLQCRLNVFDQYNEEVVCEFNPPMFEVF